MKKLLLSVLLLMATSLILVLTYADDYEKACDGGDADGCYNLGLSYAEGEGGKQEMKKANTLYEKACDGGSVEGCYNLGLSYAEGDGVKQDYEKAKELFGKACDGGDAEGCKNYAILNKR